MKRHSPGADCAPVAGLGDAVDDSQAAACRIGFEPSYEPLLVSPDATRTSRRGRRLQLKAGAFASDPRGGTPAAA